MLGEPREHGPLIIHVQVEEAVPGNKAVETPGKVQLTHIRHQPLALWMARAAQGDHGWRRIDANDFESEPEDISSDRLSHAAANVEHSAAGWDVPKKPIYPALLEEASASVTIVLGGASVVESNDVVATHQPGEYGFSQG
jgi:hypothetical protein